MTPLPLVLAGPIVRRVEPRSCSFWIALRDLSDSVTATIWRDIQTAGPAGGSVNSGDPKVASATTKTRRFGKQLHVALITVKIESPAPPLTPGTIYSYDIQVGSQGLKQLRLLENEDPTPIAPEERPHRPLGLALGYVEGRLPSFVTPPPVIEQTRLAHCSCRNTIGPGYDALAWLDDIIEATLTDPVGRPQQLFMTGDQIYADDLSSSLLFMLSGLAAQIVGANEQMRVVAQPREGGAPVDGRFDVTLENFPPNNRHKIVVELGGYTTGDGENHLLSFGEYAAMYLAAWSPRVWSALGTADQIFLPPPPDPQPLRPFFDEPEKRKPYNGDIRLLKDAAKGPTSGFTTGFARAELFRVGVPHVARALANVATYMIFDDHDVTDDWNLHKKWTNRVYSKEFGRQLVRNAVMAYGVFQGWGNDPAVFESGKNKELLDEIERLYAGDGPYPVAGSTERIDTLCGVTGAAFTEQAVWNYIVPAPKMQVVVLDTRTRRKFTGEGYLPPDLVGLNRDQQLPAGPPTDGRELVFVVSAAPVLGPDIIDTLGWPAAQVAIDVVHQGKGLDGSGVQTANIGVEKYDAEGWSSNDLAREQLLARLATYPRVVLLSGDVHFADSITLDYYKKGAPAPSRIVQLTSSPARNQFKAVVRLLLRQNAMFQTVETEYSGSRLAWTGPSSLVVPAGQFVSPGRRSRMKRSPSLLPAEGWPAGTSFPSDKPTDWRWRLTVQRDPRPETALPTALRQQLLPASDEVDESHALAGYRAIATRHQTAAATRFEFLRQMVFKSNIGIVRLVKDASGSVTLRHTLVSESGPDAVTGTEATVHEIPLAPSPKPPPEVEFR
jgi:hypothetical protein